MFNPLQTQQLASDPKNSVWVMASAGSGKTKVLTDRILRLLLEDVAPHKILCLTYTKVASVEMQERLNHELQNWIICSDEELFEKLLNLTGIKPENQILSKARGLLIKNLDAELKIKIQTIHSSMGYGIIHDMYFSFREWLQYNRSTIKTIIILVVQSRCSY